MSHPTFLVPANEGNSADVSNMHTWRSFADNFGSTNEKRLLDRAEYGALSTEDAEDYDDVRRDAMANLPKFGTPMGEAVADEIRTTLTANTRNLDPGVRAGIFVSATSSLGKSTLVTEVAVEFDRWMRGQREKRPQRYATYTEWVPVVWIGVPANVTISNLCRRVIGFYGEEGTLRARTTESTLVTRVQALARDCGTKLIVLDDITRLRMHREQDQNAADWLRSFMETSVSIIAVGVDVRNSGLLSEGNVAARERNLATQTRRRFKVLDLESFHLSEKGQAAWFEHLKQVESVLPLLDRRPGLLTDHADLLYARTHGVIGSLTRLITEVGMQAICSTETVTAEAIRGAVLDHAADIAVEAVPSIPAQQRRRRPGSNSMYNDHGAT